MKKSIGQGSLAESVQAPELLHVKEGFSSHADFVRNQFQNQLYGTIGQSGGISSLTYAFCRDTYGFLTANAEQLLPRAELDAVLNEIGDWAIQHLGTSFVSTPQFRVYIDGCSRNFARDEVDAKWHYILWLTYPLSRSRNRGRIQVITDDAIPVKTLAIHQALDLEPKYNDLLVHDTRYMYSLEVSGVSMDPGDAVVFLEGYLW